MQQDGEEAFYDGTPLEHINTYPDEFMGIWIRFEQRLRHEVRFFRSAMTTANGYTGCRSQCAILRRIKHELSVPLREMQYENCSFAIDVLQCERCGGAMRIVAAIHPPEITGKILDCLGLPSRAPPLRPAMLERSAHLEYTP